MGCFDVWRQFVDTKEVSIQYVRILKDIFKLNYDLMHTHIVILHYKWIKWKDNQGNPTYVWGHVGFLIINFWHELPMTFGPFIFPCQVTFVLFWRFEKIKLKNSFEFWKICLNYFITNHDYNEFTSIRTITLQVVYG
jgi:hypothetical protein